jgi:hypothetical protein
MSDTRPVAFPLTAAQSGVWFAQQLDPASPAHQIAECLEIQGAVDVALFERAVRQLLLEGEFLRLRIRREGDDVVQYVAPVDEATVHLVDVSGEPDPWQAVQQWIHADLARPLDLEHEPAGSMAVFPAGPERLYFYQRAHHLAADGYTGSRTAPGRPRSTPPSSRAGPRATRWPRTGS